MALVEIQQYGGRCDHYCHSVRVWVAALTVHPRPEGGMESHGSAGRISHVKSRYDMLHANKIVRRPTLSILWMLKLVWWGYD